VAIFYVMGPVMIGPSSLYTAGAAAIGREMQGTLRETSLGGLAATPTAVGIATRFKRGCAGR